MAESLAPRLVRPPTAHKISIYHWDAVRKQKAPGGPRTPALGRNWT